MKGVLIFHEFLESFSRKCLEDFLLYITSQLNVSGQRKIRPIKTLWILKNSHWLGLPPGKRWLEYPQSQEEIHLQSGFNQGPLLQPATGMLVDPGGKLKMFRRSSSYSIPQFTTGTMSYFCWVQNSGEI